MLAIFFAAVLGGATCLMGFVLALPVTNVFPLWTTPLWFVGLIACFIVSCFSEEIM